MKAFRKAVEADDMEAMERTLAEDIEFRSPAVFKPYKGRAEVAALIRKVSTVLEDFDYASELVNGEETALVFKARIGDRELQGIDLGRIDPKTGLITHLTVFIRPASGLQALVMAMSK